MKTCVASILLMMLSLVALLLAAGLSSAAAIADDNMDAIRLPTDDGTELADLLTAMTRATAEGEKKRRPWRCCDMAVCTRSMPPMCRCLDKVERCSSACKACTETEDSRHICADLYHGFPGPRCKEDDVDGGLADLSVSTVRDVDVAAAAAAVAVKKDDEETRPWKCCDQLRCTRSWPPICRCMDLVQRCDEACKRCEEVEGSSDSSHHRCVDVYKGFDLAPPCSSRKRGRMRRAVDAILRSYYGY